MIYLIDVDWLNIEHVHVVHKNISWTCTRFHLKNKISNIFLFETNVDVKNTFVEVNSISLIDALNQNVSNPFNELDGKKINYLIGGGVFRLNYCRVNWGYLFA